MRHAAGFLCGFSSTLLLIWTFGGRPNSVQVVAKPRPQITGAAPLSSASAEVTTSDTVSQLRSQSDQLRELLRRSTQVEGELRNAINATRSPGGETQESMHRQPDGAEEPREARFTGRRCPAGCTRHGNCDEVAGKCSCPPTYEGAACDVPTMPSCAIGTAPDRDGDADDGFINLSNMASEQFWWMMRDVRPDPKQDERRRAPPYRWMGLVTCACVREALDILSLQRSPQPAPWPRYIGHSELAMQRVACISGGVPSAAGRAAASDGAPAQDILPVGALWASGARGGRSKGLRWSHVPIVAWLKPYPAHSPMLLPLGLVSEAAFTSPSDRHLTYLAHKELRAVAAAPPPPPTPLRTMLPTVGSLSVLPLARCAHRCHDAGWCGVWRGPWGTTGRRCHCLRDVHRESHGLRTEAERWRGPPGSRQENGVGGAMERDATSSEATCAPSPRRWVDGMQQARYARTPEQMQAFDASHSLRGIDRWRTAQATIPRAKACPNECLGRGACEYGFCHCQRGYWGLDCGLSAQRIVQLRRATLRPRVYVYEVPAALRRACAPWTLPEDLGDRLLLSDHLESDASRADLFWVYGCPNGDTVLPMLQWIKRTFPHWSDAVRDGRPRHMIASGHEEGWAEVWQLLGRWLGPNMDHANQRHGWDDLHPASPTRQLGVVQLHGGSDYRADGKPLRRGVSGGASCRVCFQPGKDVVVPGFPGIMDYPDDHGRPALYKLGGDDHGGRISQCRRIAREVPYADDGVTLQPRRRSPQLLMAGVVQTKTHGPGLYEASRLVPYSCWKNRSSANDFEIRQTETVTISVNRWEIEQPLDVYKYTRHASMCAVPEGKIGSYGHRSINSLMLGCVPLLTKERYSYNFFHEVINWSRIALHVPPAEMPHLLEHMRRADVEVLRRAGTPLRRRLLWTSIYGNCHLREGEGGQEDAFDTLMQVLARPRRHFQLSDDHRQPRAPEMLDELNLWLEERGGKLCTHGYRCFDQWRCVCCMPRSTAPFLFHLRLG